MRFDTRIPGPPLRAVSRRTFFGLLTLLIVGTALVSWVLIGSWVGLVLGASIGILGAVGGLFRYEWWRRKGRWYPGMGLYGESSNERPRDGDTQP